MARLALAFCFLTSVALAAPAPPPPSEPPMVALTQDQLQRLIRAEIAKAIVQEKIEAAKDAYDLVQGAFHLAPPPPKGLGAPQGPSAMGAKGKTDRPDR
jgi:hypothetical protein